MRYGKKVASFIFVTIFLTSLVAPYSEAEEYTWRFSWMVPKTTLDTTVSYTLTNDACGVYDPKKNPDKGNNVSLFKVNPLLTPKFVPDLRVGERRLFPQRKISTWQDANFTIETKNASRLLLSLSSNPTDQTGQIIGNVIGGLASLVGAIGKFALFVDVPHPLSPLPCTAETKANLKTFSDLQKEIGQLQIELGKTADATKQKDISARIQNSQNALTVAQNRLTIAVKTTIDPGITPKDVNPDDDITNNYLRQGSGSVENDGVVAQISPSTNQLLQAEWFDFSLPSILSNDHDVGNDAKKGLDKVKQAMLVRVYLDFRNGQSLGQTPEPAKWTGDWKQMDMSIYDDYRDVAYIPVVVSHGDKPSKDQIKRGEFGDYKVLAEPQLVPFGQFGVVQTLPDIRTFEKLTWAITFLESGEITKAVFTSNAKGSAASSMFKGAAADTSTGITALVNGINPAAQASAKQQQADEIYQENRLEQCRANPKTCPAK